MRNYTKNLATSDKTSEVAISPNDHQTRLTIRNAERQGFEPWIQSPVCRISSAVQSTTLPPLQYVKRTVGGEGFEPTKPKQQIYSLSHLTTLETSHCQSSRPPSHLPFACANFALFSLTYNSKPLFLRLYMCARSQKIPDAKCACAANGSAGTLMWAYERPPTGLGKRPNRPLSSSCLDFDL